MALLKVQREKSSRVRPPSTLDAIEIETLTEVKTLLMPLWQVTLEMSTDKTVTLSKCVPLVNAMTTVSI